MIVTKIQPFTKAEIEDTKEIFKFYIKTVIDIDKDICSAGCDRHFDSEQILLSNGSHQKIYGVGELI